MQIATCNLQLTIYNLKDFGYKISADKQIDFDTNDNVVITKVLRMEPSLQLCIGCGSCTATCSAGQYVNFNIRKLHTLLRRGEIKSLKAEIRKCMFCGKCQLVCPRGVNLRNLILSIHDSLENHGL